MIVCCCRHGLAWTLFLLLQISAIGLVIASVLVTDWVSSTDFSSGLYKCSDKICEKSNYSDQASQVCDMNGSSSECKLFRGLEYGMMAYLICAGVAVIATILWIMPSLCFMCRKNYCASGVIFGTIALLAQIAGVIAYALEANLMFMDCNASVATDKQPNLCAEIGYKLAIAGAVDYIVIMFFYIVCGCSTRNKLQEISKENINQSEMNNHSTEHVNHPVERNEVSNKP